jgi:hypothetical protein
MISSLKLYVEDTVKESKLKLLKCNSFMYQIQIAIQETKGIKNDINSDNNIDNIM